jgi:TrpR-related protein YerC/YecD
MELNAYSELKRVLCNIKNEKDMDSFLDDLCTQAEIETFSIRLSIVYYLRRGLSYRAIHNECGASLVTISRVAHSLKYGNGGYKIIYKNIVAEK